MTRTDNNEIQTAVRELAVAAATVELLKTAGVFKPLHEKQAYMPAIAGGALGAGVGGLLADAGADDDEDAHTRGMRVGGGMLAGGALGGLGTLAFQQGRQTRSQINDIDVQTKAEALRNTTQNGPVGKGIGEGLAWGGNALLNYGSSPEGALGLAGSGYMAAHDFAARRAGRAGVGATPPLDHYRAQLDKLVQEGKIAPAAATDAMAQRLRQQGYLRGRDLPGARYNAADLAGGNKAMDEFASQLASRNDGARRMLRENHADVNKWRSQLSAYKNTAGPAQLNTLPRAFGLDDSKTVTDLYDRVQSVNTKPTQPIGWDYWDPESQEAWNTTGEQNSQLSRLKSRTIQEYRAAVQAELEKRLADAQRTRAGMRDTLKAFRRAQNSNYVGETPQPGRLSPSVLEYLAQKAGLTPDELRLRDIHSNQNALNPGTWGVTKALSRRLAGNKYTASISRGLDALGAPRVGPAVGSSLARVPGLSQMGRGATRGLRMLAPTLLGTAIRSLRLRGQMTPEAQAQLADLAKQNPTLAAQRPELFNTSGR